jgi:adenosine deaminase
VRECGLTPDDLRRMTQAAIDASFLSETVRAQAQAALQAWAQTHDDPAPRPAD